MNVVVVQGTLSSEPRERLLPSGSTIVNWEVTTSPSSGPKLSVPVQWEDPGVSIRSCSEGDEVMVLGTIRRRFFSANGIRASRVEVHASVFANPARAAAVSRLRKKADGLLAG